MGKRQDFQGDQENHRGATASHYIQRIPAIDFE